MKNIFTPVLFVAFLFLLTASECKKPKQLTPDNPYGLPNATQTGANIFACRLNGQNWISKSSIFNLGGGITKDTLYAHGSNPISSTYYEQFDIAITDFVTGRNFFMLNDTTRRFAKFSTNKPCFLNASGYGIGYGKNYTGELSLTKVDTVNKILSGTFWFNIKTDYCDTLKITDGRFDIRYY